MLLYSVSLVLLWLKPSLAVDVPSVASSEDISQINNLRADEGPAVSIDPRLRRALLRVLTKLDEEDRRKGHQEAARQMAEVMQNIITEEDFIKYFQEQGLEKELLEHFESKETQSENEKNLPNLEEILSYSSDDSQKESETPFTFASYPEDKNEGKNGDLVQDFKNKDKYPATNPTPSLRDAIYFQIPEPIHISESEVKEEKDSGTFNVQETRSIQGPTLVSPTEDNSYHAEQLKVQEEENTSLFTNNQSDKENIEEEQKVSFITVDQTKSNEYQGRDNDKDLKTEVDFQTSNGTEVQDTEDSGNSSMKVKLEKHEVEFLHAPLLAAFTVQQDQQGLPRRVIPLNYQASGEPIPLPSNKDQQSLSKQNSIEDKQKQLQQQVNFLQDQQLQEQQYQRLQEFVKQRQRLLEEEAQRQLIIENQKRQYENEQRLIIARQRQQQILFQNQQQDSQLEALKELERQRYYQQQQNYQSNIQNPQNVHFQKSVDFQFQANAQQPASFSQPSNKFQNSFNNYNTPFQPSVELNRVNRHEPSNFIGNFGLSNSQPSFNFHSSGRATVQPFVQPTQSTYIQPSNFIQPSFQQHRFSQSNQFLRSQPSLSVDGQIQSLLSIAGIAGGLQNKPNAQEDLNIVSKVLALGHGEAQFQRQQFQASTKHETIVEPPSRVVEPPKL
ncbi:signal transducer and activator of transcription C-like [Homalodisca vitripennis]|uniref:signal transducer and activator of transcription C-like n=1 Tax=Homalodisca vitripennis TaxID=197043 RepID=UPI001EEAC27D|nr:signal transducer and activator of transcription C-like [Homalodisca vitripennis]